MQLCRIETYVTATICLYLHKIYNICSSHVRSFNGFIRLALVLICEELNIECGRSIVINHRMKISWLSISCQPVRADYCVFNYRVECDRSIRWAEKSNPSATPPVGRQVLLLFTHISGVARHTIIACLATRRRRQRRSARRPAQLLMPLILTSVLLSSASADGERQL